jgi:hypothetical protein
LGSSFLLHDAVFALDALQGTAHGFAPSGTALAFQLPGPYNFRATWW